MGVTVREKKKGSDKWYVFVSTGGKRTSKLVGNKKTAIIVADKLRARIALGQAAFEQNKPAPKFSDYARNWLNGYVENKLKPSTRRSYKSLLHKHLMPAFKKDPIDTITRDMIKDLLMSKSGNLSDNRVKRIQSCFSCIMTMAIDDGIITANPATGLQKYIGTGQGVDIPDPYSVHELNTYLTTCLEKYPAYYPFFLLLARTGLRLGEALALRWGDIDHNGSFISVRRSFSDGFLTTPKNKKPRRVPMSPMLADALKQLRTIRKNQTLKNGWRQVPEYIYITEKGTVYHPGNLTRRVHNKITEQSGLRRIRLHDFRHTYATLRLSKGDPIQNVSKALGHSSIRITIDTYMMYIPEADQDAVDELDTLGTIDTIKQIKEV